MNETQKKDLVDRSAEAAAKILIFTMDVCEIHNYIEATIVNEPDGREFKLRFEHIPPLNDSSAKICYHEWEKPIGGAFICKRCGKHRF